MSHRKGKEGQIREGRSAAHGKHMNCMNSASIRMHTWMKKKVVVGVCGRTRCEEKTG